MAYAPEPTQADIADPFFGAIWQAIKDWELIPGVGVTAVPARPKDAMRILAAVRETAAQIKQNGGRP